MTFFTESVVEQLRSIANVMKASGCPVADWMLKLKPMAKDERRRRAVAPIARKPTAAAGAVSGGGMSWFLVYTVACLHAHACIQSHTVACLPRHHLQASMRMRVYSRIQSHASLATTFNRCLPVPSRGLGI